MPSLWDVENELAKLMENCPDDVEPGSEVAEAVKGALVHANEKRDSFVCYLDTLDAQEEHFKHAAEVMLARAKSVARRREWLMGYALGVMRALNVEKLTGDTRSLRVAQNPASVEVEGEPPPEYTRVVPEKREWDKRKVKAAIEAGEEIVNARLVPGAWRLVVR